MIFYFSGTGNSKHVAKLLCQNEHIVDMSRALQKRKCGFHLKENEAAGIICPVYYSGVPKVVLEFLRHMKLKDYCSYMYLVLTHGGGPGAAGAMAEHELKKRGYHLDAIFDVRMPANYIMLGDLAPLDEEDKRIKEAEASIQGIRTAVLNRQPAYPGYGRVEKLLSWSMYPLCDRYMPVKKFYADDTCTGCGACEAHCPLKCIELKNGKPVWKKNQCVRCMACLSCYSVQYGEKTKTRRRYRYHTVE